MFSIPIPFSGGILALLMLCFCSIGCWEISGIIKCSKDKLQDSYSALKGAKVQLWEYDIIDSDDHLSEDQDAVTDQYGNFYVEGSERELIGKTDPYLLVEHNCEDPLHPLEKEGCVYVTRVVFNFVPERQNLKINVGNEEYAASLFPKGSDEVKISTTQKC